MSEPSDRGACPRCGAQVTNDASFCIKCGTALSPLPTDTVAPAEPPTASADSDGLTGWWAHRSRRQKIGIVAGSLIAVLVVGSALGAPNEEDQSAAATPSARLTATATATPDSTPTEAPTPTPEPTPEPTEAPPTPAPTPSPTPPPTPEPTPVVVTFGGGDLVVGADVMPGTYRTRSPSTFCYWERVSGFGGTLDEILANGTGGGYFTVTIGPDDAGFSSSGCGTWSADLSAVTNPAGPITDDGVYIVGADIAPGTWRSDGGGAFGCYAARLSGFGGTLNEIIANDISNEGGLIITVAASDRGFETTGCGTWSKVG